ncbi:MAG: alpha/beta fold hydrolase, partial [Pseudomonadota bacterium]
MSGAEESGGTRGQMPQPDWLDLARRGLRLAEAMGRASAEGIEIATTPKDEIWRDAKTSLHRYRATRAPAPVPPLLIVHGLFGRQSIVDLEPGRSLVHRLLGAGVDVWVLDWGSPSRADRHLDLTDYADYWLGDALEILRAETGQARAALLGICQGGVFALLHAARYPEAVAGLALAVTPIDFHADRQDPEAGHGLLNHWARSLGEDLIEDVIAERANLPGTLTGSVFEQLLPAQGIVRHAGAPLDLVDDPAALATYLRMEKWLADRPDHPGAAAREWLIDCYARNALIQGRLALDGVPVDLKSVRCAILNIVARHDHIVPPPCSLALEGRTASPDYRVLDVPT